MNAQLLRVPLLLIAAGFSLLLAPTAAFAQVQQGVIEGVIVDSTGLPLPGATIDVTDPSTNLHRTTTADSEGRFRVQSLPPAEYDVTGEIAGFGPFHQRVPLSVGQTMLLRITLEPAGVTQTVFVSAAAPALDASRTSQATVVDAERIEETPVRTRKYLDFALLTPGVIPTGGDHQPPSSTSSPVIGSGFSIAGARPRSGMLTIDGLDNNDEYSGGGRTELSLETVREFEVVTNGWSAENGGGSGGVINVVTRSGTNTLHGDVFVFGQSGRFNARPRLEETLGVKPLLHRYRVGFAVGGPVISGRTFYYAAAEQEERRSQAGSDIGIQTATSINAFLGAGALPGLVTRRLAVGLFDTGLSETEMSVKVTHQVTPRHGVNLRLAANNSRSSADAFNSGGLVDVSARGTSGTRDDAASGSWLAVVGTRATNEMRGQVARRRTALHTGDGRGPGIVIAGVAEFGRSYAGNEDHVQHYFEVADTFAWNAGTHFVKVGTDLTRIRVRSDGVPGTGGLYIFPTLNAFFAGVPDSFRQVFAPQTTEFASTRSAVFVQEHWTPHSRVTVDAGLRFDTQALPSELGVTRRQFSPRAGAAWTPVARWVIRANAGLFSDRVPLAAVERSLAVGGPGFEQVPDSPLATSALANQQGSRLTAPLATLPPSIYRMRRGAWSPRSVQSAVSVERAVTDDITASMTYLFARGRALPRTMNVNVSPTVTTARIDPRFTDVFELQPTGESWYRGVTFAIASRLAHEIEWSASYTRSRTQDTASDFDEQPQNPNAPGEERGPSRYDEPHRFVASGLFELPIGDEEDLKPGDVLPVWARVLSHIELAPIVTIASGHPVNPLTGRDDLRTHSFPLSRRPQGFTRNGLRTPACATVDLRVLKFLVIPPHGKLDFVVEAFNLLNRTNAVGLNPFFGPGGVPSSGFGRALDAAAARQIEFSVDFEF